MDWSSARTWLAECGFVPEPADASEPLRYRGAVITEFGKVDVNLHLDINGIGFPAVQLVKKPGWLPEVCAHLNHNLYLCCTDRSTGSPDRRYPQAIVERVLERARNLLVDLVVNGGNAADEFVKLWGGEHSPAFGYLESPSDGVGHWQTVKIHDGSWFCITPTEKLGSVKDWLGTTKHSSCLTPIHISVSRELLAKGPGWPIRSIHDLDRWLGYVDTGAQDQFQVALHALTLDMAGEASSDERLFVLIHHDTSDIGICFDIRSLTQWLPRGVRRVRGDGARQLYNALIQDRQGNPVKYRFVNVDPARMLDRAMGTDCATLTGKKVILIGAGSVGSHLGMALARSGAGSGSGELTVYDSDVVSVENVTRSAYDTRHVSMNKAEALASLLRGTLVDIQVLPKNIPAPADVSAFDADLIIDASGDHGFSTWLSSQRLLDAVPTVQFCWVSGRGAAVVTYLQASSGDSCLACLAPADSGSEWNPLISAEEGQSHQIGPCGESFMPYSVGAPMVAAGLAIAQILEWVRGDVRSPVRSVVLAPDRARSLPSEAPAACTCGRS